jgi:acyl-CoA thioesterase
MDAKELNEAEFFEQLKAKMAADQFAAAADVELVAARPGYAKTRMVIRDMHYNAAGVVQGGAVFTLADFAFAAATNYGEQVALAIDCQLSFLRPAKAGTLWAETELIGDSKSLASYVVRVTDDQGRLTAQFYGRAFKRTS